MTLPTLHEVELTNKQWILVTMPVLERMDIEAAAEGRATTSRVATPEAVAGHLVVLGIRAGNLHWMSLTEFRAEIAAAEIARTTPTQEDET